MAKIKNISGFPEWLPEQKLVEDKVICKLKSIFESHGFTPVETPSVELMSTLSSKGVIDKELYALKRAKAEDDQEAELGLHFDLTVPISRYIAQHFNDLDFPFKRYQLQRSWRGERPQKGRFREFYQFDIDTFAIETLPLACDAEILLMLDKAFKALALGDYTVKINDRRILLGLYASLNLDGAQGKQAITTIDKLHKIGMEGVIDELSNTIGLDRKRAEQIVNFCAVKAPVAHVEKTLSDLGIENELFAQGAEDLSNLLSQLPEVATEHMELDLSLARGLDYYTGLIVETHLDAHPEFGSVCGGGRYDGLVSQFLNKKVPGIGVAFGLTRLMELIFNQKLMSPDKKTPSEVLVAVYNEGQRHKCNVVAEELRAAGVATEVFFKAPKLGKQIDYAAKKYIPFVLFVNEEDGHLEIKDIDSGEQEAISSIKDWVSKTLNR